MKASLTRFIEAQYKDFEIALSEIKSGRKKSHWMWYIFPQFQGLGYSATARFYAISSLDEAVEFLNHPILGKRLLMVTSALLELEQSDPLDIFGSPDYMKLQSSMTLFSIVSENPIFDKVLQKFFNGAKDQKTQSLSAGK